MRDLMASPSMMIYDCRPEISRVLEELAACAKPAPSSLQITMEPCNVCGDAGRDFKLDSFKWLKDESVEEAGELPPPEKLTTDAIAELEGAVEELNAVLTLLENGNGGESELDIARG